MMRILIVDDTENDVSLVKYFLQDEYDCLVSTSAAEAVALLTDISFDLIISDYQLDDGDGLWLLEQLKNIQHAPPCLILTADLTVEAGIFLQAGAKGFCYRHLIVDSLLKEVRRILD